MILNIIFSALLNSAGKIGRVLTYSRPPFSFYSCDFLKIELFKHRNKLLKYTQLSPDVLDEYEQIITSNITFINEELIPADFFSDAIALVKDVDYKDVPFVALTKYLNGKLWTGDKKLIEGLISKKFDAIVTTALLFDLTNSIEG